MKKTLLGLAIAGQLVNAEFTEYLYYPKPFTLNNGNVVINNSDTFLVANELPHIIVNNFVNKNQGEVMKSFSTWDPGTWTSLWGATSNYGFATSSYAGVGYGATAVQSKAHKVGMHLNTYGKTLPGGYTGTSLQYAVRFNNHDLWNTRPNDDLCIVLSTDIYSSYSHGATNQALATFIFNDHDSHSFYFNFVLYEMNRKHNSSDYIKIDEQDTYGSIVISYVDSTGGTSKYSSAMPGTNTTPYSHASKYTSNVPEGNELYAACISRSQIDMAVADLKSDREEYYANLNVSDLRLDTALVGPEINTVQGKGHIGMKVNEMWVVRRR